MHFYAFFNHFYSSIFEITLWITALSSPYIAHERTAQNLIFSVCSERFALCLKERHCSQNQGSLKSEDRKSDFKERCAQLWKIGPLGSMAGILVGTVPGATGSLPAKSESCPQCPSHRSQSTPPVVLSKGINECMRLSWTTGFLHQTSISWLGPCRGMSVLIEPIGKGRATKVVTPIR